MLRLCYLQDESQQDNIIPQHQTRRPKMSAANRQDLSSALTVISAKVEGLTAVKASLLSGMCNVGHCRCLCPQETHRDCTRTAEISGMTIFVRENLKVKSVSIRDEGNVDELPSMVVHSVYKPTVDLHWWHV